jgi:hypothetical protein
MFVYYPRDFGQHYGAVHQQNGASIWPFLAPNPMRAVRRPIATSHGHGVFEAQTLNEQ